MNLLLINSGDENPFAALYNSKELILSYSSEFKNESARKLPDNLVNCIQKLSDNNRKEFEQIKAIAVIIGPGSFTGIRVGLAIAKGTAFAYDIPVIPVSNFELMFSRIPDTSPDVKYCLLIGAKLPECYYSIWSSGNELTRGCINIDELSSILDEKTTIVANFDNETIGKHSYFRLINTEILEDDAKTFLKLALSYFDKGTLRDTADIEPLYMKDFVIKKH